MKFVFLILMASLSAHAMKIVEAEKTLETATTVSVARSSTAVNVASIGGDSLAFVVTASSVSTPAGSSAFLYGSIDCSNYLLVGSGISVAAAGSYALTLDRPPLKCYRVTYAISSGSYLSTLKVLVKGDKE